MSKSSNLRKARKKLGIGQVRLSVVADTCAQQLGVPSPKTRQDRYRVISVFVHADGVVAKAKPSSPNKIKHFVRAGVIRSVPQPVAADVNAPEFLQSYEWRRLRMVVLTKRGARCECCGASPSDGVRLNVDHIKPRRLFPELALVEANLQVLCADCNHGKGNWDQTDWREQHGTGT